MRAADVLARAREARRRIRSIDESIELMRGRVGPQGHDYKAKAKYNALDPMRHVCDVLDALGPLEDEREACRADVEDARRLCRGVAALVNGTIGDVLEMHFCDGMSAEIVAARLHYPESLTRGIIDTSPAELDSVGVPRLMHAGR